MLLSEIFDGELNNKIIDKIIYDGIEYKGEKFKYAIVFGNPLYQSFRVKVAATLYKQGKVEKIILSGGIGRNDLESTISEAEKMRIIAINEGIDEKDLILEDTSTTTIENVQNIADFFNKNNINPENIILISSIWHMRRCLAICTKYLLMVDNYYLAPASDGIAERDSWQETEIGKETVEREIYYLKKHIAEKRIADLNIYI